MSFDLRPQIAIGAVPWQVDQFQQGAANAWNNCVPTSTLLGLASMGYATPTPQYITDQTYWPGYVGGEDFGNVWQTVASDFGLSWGYQSTSDPTYVDQMAATSNYNIGFFHCDSNATITLGPGGFYHASPVVAHFEATDQWIVLNVHDGSIVTFTSPEFRQALASGFVIFNQPIPGGPIQPIPLPTFKEEDEMYRDLAPNEMWPCPVAPNTNFNLVAYSDSSVGVAAYHPTGQPIGGKTYTLTGNVDTPGVGPVEAYDSAAGLGIGSDGGVLTFNNTGANRVTLWLHREG